MRAPRELGGRLRRHPRRHGRPVTRPALARGIVVGWTHLGRSDRSAPPNDTAQQPAGLKSRDPPKCRDPPPVCCTAWFGLNRLTYSFGPLLETTPLAKTDP